MAVNLTNSSNALKTYYLDAISEQLNNANPLLAMIKKTSDNVYGKDVKMLAIHGVNGGIGAGSEEGALPNAAGNKYAQFTGTLKNLYGTIEISDKAIRASESNAGAFVNLLNAEMDGLIKASNANFARMLFGDGSGVLATISSIKNNTLTVDSVKNLEVGMLVQIFTNYLDVGPENEVREIIGIDRDKKEVTLGGDAINTANVPSGFKLCTQGSVNQEILGLEYIFGSSATIYGLNKSNNLWVKPYHKTDVGEITEMQLQTALDEIEERGGASANVIVCSMGVRRALYNLFSQNKRVLDTVELAGGFKALSYNGIPIVADKFCPEGTLYILNTDDFVLNQLCDWQWLSGEDGNVLKQVAGKPVYTATLVKYAELMCARPYAQGKLSGITEA